MKVNSRSWSISFQNVLYLHYPWTIHNFNHTLTDQRKKAGTNSKHKYPKFQKKYVPLNVSFKYDVGSANTAANKHNNIQYFAMAGYVLEDNKILHTLLVCTLLYYAVVNTVHKTIQHIPHRVNKLNIIQCEQFLKYPTWLILTDGEFLLVVVVQPIAAHHLIYFYPTKRQILIFLYD